MSNGRTHWEGCYKEYGHKDCAVAEIERLETRLEVYPVNLKTGERDKSVYLDESCDGIACRDETIKLQDKRIAELEAEIERLQARVETLEACKKYARHNSDCFYHLECSCGLNQALDAATEQESE